MGTQSTSVSGTVSYSVEQGAKAALKALLKKCGSELPRNFEDIIDEGKKFKFISSLGKGDVVLFPCPLKQQDAVGAIKAVEALMVSALAELRFEQEQGAISVDMMKVACFISSAYITTVGGYHKGQEEVKQYLPDTDHYHAQSNLYRRLSAGMYLTKDKEYYHIHGSLEPSKIFKMLDLKAAREDLTDYDKCIEVWENAVQQFESEELESMNQMYEQAGVQVLTRDEFLGTQHGKVMNTLPPFTVRASEHDTPFGKASAGPESKHDTATPPIPIGEASSKSGPCQVLQGIRVLELCRIIAGPTIGRSLAALGADVLKVTSDKLPDVPFFQVDGNTGKYCISLDFNVDKDRTKFEELLQEADVIIDGYRPGSLERRGYGPTGLAKRAIERRRGYVYVAEDCFGGTKNEGYDESTPWAGRRGWQQIADCVTGVAREQGRFMNAARDEPVIPPFPMSDYGTGALGSLAALVGLYNRAKHGGSWICRTSLVQYNLFLLSLGNHTEEVQKVLREQHTAFLTLRHYDSVDRVGQAALESINAAHNYPFEDVLMQEAWCPGFRNVVKWPKEAVKIEGLRIGHTRVTRPNGYDKVEHGVKGWKDWEIWERNEKPLEEENNAEGNRAGMGDCTLV